MDGKKNTIKLKKSSIYIIIGIIIVVVITGIYFSNFKATGDLTKEVNKENLEVKFGLLSGARTNSCGGTFNYVDSKPDEDRIQGACCGAMDFHRYTEQIEGLRKYSNFEKIPSDPYDVPVSLAKELLEYQKNIQLTIDQQKIYDQAVNLSKEGGPCCCKCWHWYAYEGLAKYLITEHDFNADQIAELWDLSDACGGSGHTH